MHGAWLSLVERCVRDAEVAGSNPVAPIFNFKAGRIIALNDPNITIINFDNR